MATPIKKVVDISGVNFGSLDMYVAGGGLPEGDYAFEFNVQMYQAVNAQNVNQGPPRLGVMVRAHSLTDPAFRGETARHQFYSMGSNADKSFAPNAETGKGLVLVPGAAGQTLNNSTNWSYLLKSLYDSGLPQGVFTNDFTVIDGIHVHVSQVPEPEERKAYAASKTGEAAMAGTAEPTRKGTIAIVTEIKDDGKPWEGTGGIPTEDAAPAKVVTATRVNGKPVPIAVTVAAVAGDDEDVQTAAINAISEVLETKPMGLPKLVLKTTVFGSLEKGNKDMAQNVATLLANESSLSTLLGSLGYVIAGAQVKPR